MSTRTLTTVGIVALLGIASATAPAPTSASDVARLAGPTVTSITPDRGGPDGHFPIAVKGSGFTASSTVAFGGEPAASTDVRSSSVIYALPPKIRGSVDVQVTTGGSTSAPTGADRYTVARTPDIPQATVHLGARPVVQACDRDDFCMIVGENGRAVLYSDGPVGNVAFPSDFTVLRMSCGSFQLCAATDGLRVIGFDGTAWSAPVSLGDNFARAVSCSRRRCVAVSPHHWWSYDGQSWSGPKDGPDATHIGDGSTGDGADISCPTATICLATVEYRFAPADPADDHSAGSSYRLSGDVWKRIDVTHRAVSFVRPQITCATATYCLGALPGVTQRWNGTSWVPADYLASANPECFEPRHCVGVARVGNPSVPHIFEIAPRRVVDHGPIPDTELYPQPLFSCNSWTSCYWISYFGTARHWTLDDGFRRAPQLLLVAGSPIDVSCVAGPFCMTINAGGQASGWTRTDGMRRPDFLQTEATLTAVSCSSAHACSAVDTAGYSFEYRDGKWRTLLVRIDDVALTDISCATDDFCVAVDAAGRVVRHEDGSWHTPTRRIPDGPLRSVSCPSATSCMAVGNGYAVRYFGQGRWGQAVRIGTHASLVSCASARSCDVVVDGTTVRTFGGQAFSPPFSFAQDADYGGLSCVDNGWCMLSSADDGTNVLVLDGSAHRRYWGFPFGIYSPTRTVSCWARGHCMFVGHGDLVDVS